MPNWVFNHLSVTGDEDSVKALKERVGKPYSRLVEDHKWDEEKKEWITVTEEITLDNPVFSFHNIYNHREMGISDEDYAKQPMSSEKSTSDPDWWADVERLRLIDKSWYSWNITHWGTKWDVAVSNEQKYPDTEITDEDATSIGFRFQTAWSPPVEAIAKLALLFPTLEIQLSYEEETGWGGEILFKGDEMTELESYENKCRDCDAINSLDYCDTCAIDVCSKCLDFREANPNDVKECETHSALAGKVAVS